MRGENPLAGGIAYTRSAVQRAIHHDRSESRQLRDVPDRGTLPIRPAGSGMPLAPPFDVFCVVAPGFKAQNNDVFMVGAGT